MSTPAATPAPSSSISSSRRTSQETAGRSSTIGSPSLGPTTTSTTSNSATQLAAARRNRAALRDFYGLKSPPAQNQTQSLNGKRGDEAENEEVQPSILDSAGFDASGYVKSLLSTEGLEGVLKTESNLVSEIRSLDGDRKALVYDNYSKLITATDTIRRMRAKMDPLAPTTSTLTPAIAHIAGTAERLARDVQGKAELRRARDNASSQMQEQQEKKGQLATVKWIVAAPARYRGLIERGDAQAIEGDWAQVRRILEGWEKKGVEGAEELRLSCEEIIMA